MALTTQERTNIEKLVVAMYNAVPGAGYLSELTTAYEANGRSLLQLARDLSSTASYKALNPVFQTASEFATAFLTPYGLQANAEAIAFVTAKFNAGLSKGQIAYEAAVAIDGYTGTDATILAAQSIQNNKATVAEYYSVTKGVTDTNVGNLQAVVASVNATAASVTTAKTNIDNGAGTAGGSTFALTTGTDNLVGTSGNDIFVGDFGVSNQLSAADQVNGGAGVDTLKLFGTYDSTKLPGLTSIETLELASSLANGSYTFSGITGLTKVQLDSVELLNNQTVTTGAGQALQLQTAGGAVAAGAITWAAASADTSNTLTLNGFETAATAPTALTVTGAGMTTLNVVSQTAANKASTLTASTATTTVNVSAATALTLANLTATSASTVNVTGAGAVVINASDFAATVTVDASAATGAVTYAAEAAGSTLTFKAGSGGSTVNMGTTLTTADKLTGGSGVDTIGITDTTSTGIIAGVNAATGFEAVALGADALTLSVASITNGINQFKVASGAFSDTFTNGLSTTTYTIDNSAGNAGTVTIANKVGENIATVTLDAGAATAAQTLAKLTLSGVATLNLVSTGTGAAAANTITTLANADNSIINITGSKNLVISNALAGTAVGSKVDASAFTGKLTVTGSGFADVIIGGSGADTIDGGAGVDTITGGAGNDRINTTTASSADSLTGGDGADTFAFVGSDVTTMARLSGGTTAVVAIKDFVAGTDKIGLVNTTPLTSVTLAGAQTIATATSLATVYSQITPIAATTAAGAASAVVVTVSGGAAAGTYLYVNDSVAGVTASDDLLINITGITGTLAATDFVFA